MSIAMQARITELEHSVRVLEARIAEIEKHEQQRVVAQQAKQEALPPPKDKKKHWL